jgi:hypothetical protein
LSPALALVLVTAVPVASRAAEVGPLIKVGYDTGGDTLVTAMFTSGSSKSIKANEGFYFGVGASILTDSKDIEVEVSLSYKSARVTASNGEIEWTRVPLEALVFYRLPQFRLGGGLTYHLSPKLSGSGFASNISGKFDDSAGLVLQADYLLTPKITIGGRYTSLEYKVGGASAKSNGVGITFGMSF